MTRPRRTPWGAGIPLFTSEWCATFCGATLLCIAVAGCATQYQPNGITGGFDETQLGPKVYRVTFKGNGYTSPERAADLALLRCADLTLQSGYSYFAIVDAQTWNKVSSFTTPTQSYTTGLATAYGYGNTATAYGQSTTTTYCGQTFTFNKPSATNTIVMVKNQNEIAGMTYAARFLADSLGKKYQVNRGVSELPTIGAAPPAAPGSMPRDIH